MLIHARIYTDYPPNPANLSSHFTPSGPSIFKVYLFLMQASHFFTDFPKLLGSPVILCVMSTFLLFTVTKI